VSGGGGASLAICGDGVSLVASICGLASVRSNSGRRGSAFALLLAFAAVAIVSPVRRR